MEQHVSMPPPHYTEQHPRKTKMLRYTVHHFSFHRHRTQQLAYYGKKKTSSSFSSLALQPFMCLGLLDVTPQISILYCPPPRCHFQYFELKKKKKRKLT
jgi:hypothetical protein